MRVTQTSSRTLCLLGDECSMQQVNVVIPVHECIYSEMSKKNQGSLKIPSDCYHGHHVHYLPRCTLENDYCL